MEYYAAMSNDTNAAASAADVPSSESIVLSAEVPEDLVGNRLDQIAAKMFPDYSRARLQAWIKEGNLQLNGGNCKSRDKPRSGDRLVLKARLEAYDQWQAQAMPLDIVFEDDHLLVINKATGTVVHPGAGNADGTLLNGLLHHCPTLEQIPRAGIVHRLDKETTGLLVVAKTLLAHGSLIAQLQSREASREYEAVVNGVMTGGGRIDQPLGRHPVNRKKRAIDLHDGKEAITNYRVIKRFRSHTHVQLKLETGRTHQIRVHMAHAKYPLVGDPLYGGRIQLPKACSPALAQELAGFKRQALHARRLGVIHPATEQELSWEVPLPQDMVKLLHTLEEDR